MDYTTSSYTARITEGGIGYDTVEMLDRRDDNRVLARLHVNHYDGLVTWSNNWGMIPDFVRSGHLHSVNRGPATYGHVDVYFT